MATQGFDFTSKSVKSWSEIATYEFSLFINWDKGTTYFPTWHFRPKSLEQAQRWKGLKGVCEYLYSVYHSLWVYFCILETNIEIMPTPTNSFRNRGRRNTSSSFETSKTLMLNKPRCPPQKKTRKTNRPKD